MRAQACGAWRFGRQARQPTDAREWIDGLAGVFTLNGMHANWRHHHGPGLGAEGPCSILAWLQSSSGFIYSCTTCFTSLTLFFFPKYPCDLEVRKKRVLYPQWVDGFSQIFQFFSTLVILSDSSHRLQKKLPWNSEYPLM